MQIRTINHTDIPLILPMQERLAIYQGIHELWQPDESRLRIQIGVSNLVKGFIALIDTAPVGYCLYRLRDYSSFACRFKSLRIDDYFVEEAHRGAGVGRALLQAVAKQVPALGVDQITLEVHHANMDAKQFYESHGATPPGETIWEELTFSGEALAALQA